ncbi:cyclic nucleotide-binding domain-containing protein [Ideonella sp.]|uniref:cyclic nucleotide-binding domain-containing protein n=1 Tax=Ideonella sp. TaxID=1929293 RepID=UPI003BB5AE86
MSIEALVAAIQSLNAPDGFRPRFDARQWTVLGSYLQHHKLRAGDLLIRHRDLDRNMYLLESGTLQVYVPDDTVRRPVAILRAGAVVGEPSMFGETPRMAQVEAMSAIEVWALTRPRFEELAARHTDLGIELLRAIGSVMSERMRANLERGHPMA